MASTICKHGVRTSVHEPVISSVKSKISNIVQYRVEKGKSNPHQSNRDGFVCGLKMSSSLPVSAVTEREGGNAVGERGIGNAVGKRRRSV